MADTPDHIHRARQLRRSLTPAETILWRKLRDRRFDQFKFRRQHPVGPYFADFCCVALKLIIELDGESHLGTESSDEFRQGRLEEWGYRVIRYWNTEVFDELDAVLDAVYQHCERRASEPNRTRDKDTD